MNKPTLYIMCGLSGSGKSTIATQIANENHMIPFGWNTEKIKKRWKERFGEYKYKML